MFLLCVSLGRGRPEYATHKSYIFVVRFFHITAGHGVPFLPAAFPRLQNVIGGIKCAPQPTPFPRLPVVLRVMKSVCASNATEIMLWTACCMGFLGFIRVREFTLKSAQDFHLSSSSCPTLQQVAIEWHAEPSTLQIHLK